MSETEAVILRYIRQQGRPYNAQNVYDNLHAKISKKLIQEALASLAAQGKLNVWSHGKANFYYPRFATEGAEPSFAVRAELETQEAELARLQKEIAALKNANRKSDLNPHALFARMLASGMRQLRASAARNAALVARLRREPAFAAEVDVQLRCKLMQLWTLNARQLARETAAVQKLKIDFAEKALHT